MPKEVMMPHKAPFCPCRHPKSVQVKVLALKISDRLYERKMGGLRVLPPRVVHGVDVHCPHCHHEGWVTVVPGWRLDSWDGPKVCSCGEMTADVG
jgi:hypothetical protein